MSRSSSRPKMIAILSTICSASLTTSEVSMAAITQQLARIVSTTSGITSTIAQSLPPVHLKLIWPPRHIFSFTGGETNHQSKPISKKPLSSPKKEVKVRRKRKTRRKIKRQPNDLIFVYVITNN